MGHAIGHANSPTFGEQLRRLRQAAQLSQEELAEKAGLSRRGIQDLERGARRLPHPSTVDRLAQALGLDPHDRAALGVAKRRGVPAPTPNNLPTPLTSFIGRQREQEVVRQRLTNARLVTLTGPGGIGKTRLALHTAADLVEQFTAGVWLAELAELTDPAMVVDAVADVLTASDEIGESAITRLARAIGRGAVLLVLDNCEHVLDATADLAQSLLSRCPRLRILATSRQPLGVAGEALVRVPPLPVTGEAELLFVERAQAIQQDLSVSPAAVERICRQVDGIPLAIELAAGRLHALSAEQLAERLEDRFRLLISGSRTALPRQRTLQGTVDWSYDLLAEPERRLFRCVSVFAGGFTLDAAEAVCAADADNVLDTLSALVEQSLIAWEPAERPRYTMLETLRQYAAAKLTPETTTEVHARHLEWLIALAERANLELRRTNQAAWLEQLAEEHANVRAALGWALSTPRHTVNAARLSTALWWFWRERGYATEGRQWLDRVLVAAPPIPADVRARVLDAAGALAHSQGAYARARLLEEEALALWRQRNDKRGMLAALNTLGIVAKAEGDHAGAATMLAEMLALARELEDPAHTATALNNLAALAIDRADYDSARQLLQESLAIKRAAGDQVGVVAALHNLGECAYHLGAYAQAVEQLSESVSLSRSLGATHREAQSLHSLGLAALRLGQFESAVSALHDGLAHFIAIGDEWGIVLCLEGLAQAAVAHNAQVVAIELLAGAARWRGLHDIPVPLNERAAHEELLGTIRRGLPPSDVDRAWSRGSAASLEETARFALRWPALSC